LVRYFPAEVEESAPGVVEEDTEGTAFAVVDEVGNAFVDRVGGFLPTESIGIPKGEGFAGAVERTRLITETEEVRVHELLLVDVEGLAMPFGGACVTLDDLSIEICDGKAEIRINADSKDVGVEANGVAGLRCDGNRGCTGGREDRPGGIFRKGRALT
jgi:hypothetical protein